MPRIFASISVPKFHDKEYSKALTAAMETQLKQAAREYLKAIIPEVPVQTGMARGSFLNIGRMLRVAVPISPTHYRRGRTKERGAALSTKPSNLFQKRGNKLTFIFQTRVLHYILNEHGLGVGPYGPGKKQPPWLTFDVGMRAFNEYMKNVAPKRLPKSYEYLSRTTISLGQSNNISVKETGIKPKTETFTI